MSSSGRSSEDRVAAAIIGGSGLCTFPELKIISEEHVKTPFGEPSAAILVAEHEGRRVLFLPRHGVNHSLPPHRVPYKANLYALREMGAHSVLASCIAGGLREDIPPGSFVVPDQFVNLTWGRDGSDNPDGGFVHLPMADPYCGHLRQLLVDSARATGVVLKECGTVAVIQGSRFSTRAESEWLIRNGWDLVNMTQYPECYFARELGLCYAAVAAITDYDVGIPSTLSMNLEHRLAVLDIFRSNIRTTKQILLRTVRDIGDEDVCNCSAEILAEYYKQ